MTEPSDEIIIQGMPQHPADAAQLAVAQFGEGGWQGRTVPPQSEGGRPLRWLPVTITEAQIVELWGHGIYRCSYRTKGKRSLGSSRPFQLTAGDQPREAPKAPQQAPQPAQQAPQPAQQAHQPTAEDRAMGELLKALKGAQGPHYAHPPPHQDPIGAWLVLRQDMTAQLGAMSHMFDVHVDRITAGLERQHEAAERMREQQVEAILQITAQHRAELDEQHRQHRETIEALHREAEQSEGELEQQLEAQQQQIAELMHAQQQTEQDQNALLEIGKQLIGAALQTDQGKEMLGDAVSKFGAPLAKALGLKGGGGSPALPSDGTVGG